MKLSVIPPQKEDKVYIVTGTGAYKESGLTLIELMIALLLGVFIIGGVTQIFLSTKQTYRMQDNISRLQENARYVLETLNHDIRLAGFMGCSAITTTNPKVIANSPLIAPNLHIGGATANIVKAEIVTGGNDVASAKLDSPNPALVTTPLTNVVNGTDAITVQFAEPCGGYTTAAITGVNVSGSIMAGNTCTTSTGTPLVISDCAKSHIFRAAADNTKNKDNTNTATAVLSGDSYAAGSEVMMFRSYTYFIRRPDVSREPALYRLDNNKDIDANNPVELVEDIENMQIVYGVDTDATADGIANYYTNNPPDWTQVVSVRVTLTVETRDENLGTAGGDGRLRRNITSTIAVRNRIS